MFQGRIDGQLVAYDARTGKQVWSFKAQAPIVGAPMSYRVNGKQYVTVLTGSGSQGGGILLKLPSGEMYTFGFPVGHEGGTTGWQAWTTGRTPATVQPDGSLAFGQQVPSGFNLSEQNMRFLALDNDDPSFSWKTIKFPQDLARMKTMSEILSPSDVDLKPYKNHNGKIDPDERPALVDFLIKRETQNTKQ